VTLYPLPPGKWSADALVSGTAGCRCLWFSEALGGTLSLPMLGRISVDGHFKQFALPASVRSVRVLTLGSNGNLWFTDPDAGKVREVLLSSAR
jgi:hypothetical protein